VLPFIPRIELPEHDIPATVEGFVQASHSKDSPLAHAAQPQSSRCQSSDDSRNRSPRCQPRNTSLEPHAGLQAVSDRHKEIDEYNENVDQEYASCCPNEQHDQQYDIPCHMAVGLPELLPHGRDVALVAP
jgi:hypothetical protein